MKDKTNYHMREKPCKFCGRVGHWHTYCTDACKQKAYRARLDAKRKGEIKACDSWLLEDLGKEDVLAINALLNQVPGKKYAKLINDAIIIMVQSYHSQIRKAKTGRK